MNKLVDVILDLRVLLRGNIALPSVQTAFQIELVQKLVCFFIQHAGVLHYENSYWSEKFCFDLENTVDSRHERASTRSAINRLLHVDNVV